MATASLGLAFLGLCLVSALARIVAQATMVRLAQGTVCRLCLALCRRLLSVPLATFEGLDPAALLAVLTEDIVIVANALVGIPLLGINLPIVIVGLAYVGWLSPGVLAAGLVFAALAIAVYQATALRGMRRLALARAGQDTLVGSFPHADRGVPRAEAAPRAARGVLRRRSSADRRAWSATRTPRA